MTITPYNSNYSLTTEFRWAFGKKRNNLDELINIPTKAEEKSMVQIAFMTQDQTSRQAQSEIRAKIYSWSLIHSIFQIRESAWFTAKIQNPRTF